MSSQILVLNAGSSSIKFAVFTAGNPLLRTAQGMISGIGSSPAFTAHLDGKALPGILPASAMDHESALAWLFDWLETGGHARHLVGAGHRVVHGGDQGAAQTAPRAQTGRLLRYRLPSQPARRRAGVRAAARGDRRRPAPLRFPRAVL